jgi:iron complex transport system ATP-binding protein
MHQARRPVVTLKDVSVTFGPVVALDGVDLEIGQGTSVAVIGPNGSGKTTLLHLLAGLRRPDQGSVTIAEPDRVAYVLQSQGRGAWMPLTALEVLRMGRYRQRGLFRRLRSDDHVAVAEVAERLEITGLLGRQFGELSGGQRQRVRVAQALIQGPTVLLLDEPITGLDLASQQRILDLLDEEVARGTTVVISTHNLDEARHCSEVVLLATEVVAAGAPDDVLVADRLRVAYGGRFLGEHHHHDHAVDLLVLDDPGHHHEASDHQARRRSRSA